MNDNLPELQPNLAYTMPAELSNRLPIIYQSIESGIPPKLACAMARVPWEHFTWLTKNMPEVRMDVEAAQAKLAQKHLDIIAAAAIPKTKRSMKQFRDKNGADSGSMETTWDDAGDWKASQFVLERILKEDFAPSSTTNVNVNTSVDVTGMIQSTVSQLVESGATIVEAEFKEIDVEESEEE